MLIVFFVVFGMSCFKQKLQKTSPIIPQPKSLRFEQGEFNVSEKTVIRAHLKDKEKILKWMEDLPIKQIHPFDETMNNSVIYITLDTTFLNTASPESYAMTISTDSISIKGATEAALFYGVQNILQLYSEFGNKLPAMSIIDSPRFAVRSVMLDASSQYLSVDFLKKQIDLMARYKFNRLQWLVAGKGGWRIPIDKYPSLVEQTAWRTHHDFNEWESSGGGFCTQDTKNAYGGYYTKEEIKELVSYAADHFITLVPAIDLPCSHPRFAEAANIGCSVEEEVLFIREVLSEIISLFPSEYIYIGNGEADESCGTICPSCRSRVDKNEYIDEYESHAKTLREAEKYLVGNNRKLIAWEESLRAGLSSDATIISWHNKGEGITAASRNYKVIMSPADFSTLSYYQSDPTSSPVAMSGLLPIDRVYAFNPTSLGITDSIANNIRGIQVNIWTRYTKNYDDIEYMLYPRLFAAAEVGWTDLVQKSYLDFKRRALKAIAYIKEKAYNSFNLSIECSIRPESVKGFNSIAKNKEVHYQTLFSESFPGNGIVTLTDGERAGWHYRDGGWQGFMGENLSVIIDLEKEEPIEYIGATFVSDTCSKVYLPENVIIGVSTDGEYFFPIDTITDKSSLYQKGYHLVDYEWRGKVKARYIQYKAILPNKPEAWLFTDEIIIN